MATSDDFISARVKKPISKAPLNDGKPVFGSRRGYSYDQEVKANWAGANVESAVYFRNGHQTGHLRPEMDWKNWPIGGRRVWR